MKKIQFILSVIIIVASSCKGTTKNNSTSMWTDSVFYSVFRPNEKLQLNTLYVDSLKYMGYDDYDDIAFICLERNDMIHGRFISNGSVYQMITDLNLNRCDIIEIKWKIDSVRFRYDRNLLQFQEYAVEIKKNKR